MESHTFIAAWGEFGPTLEDVVVLTGLPVFGDSKTVAMPDDSSTKLDEEGKIRLGLLNEALTASKHKGKSPYNLWVSFFTDRPIGVSEVRVEAMLSFWLSWHVLPSGPKDGINAYVFPLSNSSGKGRKCSSRAYLSYFFVLQIARVRPEFGEVSEEVHRGLICADGLFADVPLGEV